MPAGAGKIKLSLESAVIQQILKGAGGGDGAADLPPKEAAAKPVKA